MTVKRKRVGKIRPPLENIEELFIQHTMADELWEASERVALRLQKSNFNAKKHWWALTRVPKSNVSPKVWNTFSCFLSSCDDQIFENFFNKLDYTKIDLGKFLEILHENNSNGEEIFAFFYNISPILGKRHSKIVDNATEKVKKELKSSPDVNLIKVGKFYNLAKGNNGNNFLTYQQWQNAFKKT